MAQNNFILIWKHEKLCYEIYYEILTYYIHFKTKVFFLVAKLITSVITQARYIKVRAGTYLKLQTKTKDKKKIIKFSAMQTSIP